MFNKIILASSSPRRKEILTNLGLKYQIIIPDCDENVDQLLPPDEYVKQLSQRKGENVLARIKDEKVDLKDTLIVSCDTIVYFDYGDGIILGKPKDDRDAYLMISLLSDSWHSVFSGVTLIDGNTGKVYSDAIETRVKFKMINDKQIEDYINTGEPFGKAGAYAMQLMGGAFVEKIDGDWSNVVGLPVSLFTTMLSAYFNTDIFELRNNTNNE